MKRMHTDEEIEGIASDIVQEETPEAVSEALSSLEEGELATVIGFAAGGDLIKGIAFDWTSLYGKFVRIFNLTSLSLTLDEANFIKDGAFLNGTISGYYNPILLPGKMVGDLFATGVIIACEHGDSRTWKFGRWALYQRGDNYNLSVAGTDITFDGVTGNMRIRKITPNGTASSVWPGPGHMLTSNGSAEMRWDAIGTNLAPQYDETATYDVGDLVVHLGVLYQCSTAIATAEEWDATHWTATTLAEVIKSLHP